MDVPGIMKRLLIRCRRALIALCLSAVPVHVVSQTAVEPTPAQFFGLIIHRLDSGTPWPPFPFGSWRLWDAYVGWPDLEPEQGKWNFKRLDLYVMAAQAKGVEIVYPLGMTAPWASARPQEPTGYKPGYAAEPRDLEWWRTYVRTVAERYKGRIRYYEFWNEPSDKTYFSGTPDMLVEMMKIAFETIKAVDPDAKLIAPGITGAGRHLEYLDMLLSRGAKNYLDILGHHFYVQRTGPESMLPLIREVKRIMRKNGIENKPLWNTETGWWIGNLDGTPDHPMVAKGGWLRVEPVEQAGSFVIRALVLARAEGIDRFHWYSWDSLYGLGMRDPTSGSPKPMTKAYETAVRWLSGWRVAPCQEIKDIWICRLERTGARSRWIAWTTNSASTWDLPRSIDATRVTTVGGDAMLVPENRKLVLSPVPVLLE